MVAVGVHQRLRPARLGDGIEPRAIEGLGNLRRRSHGRYELADHCRRFLPRSAPRHQAIELERRDRAGLPEQLHAQAPDRCCSWCQRDFAAHGAEDRLALRVRRRCRGPQRRHVATEALDASAFLGRELHLRLRTDRHAFLIELIDGLQGRLPFVLERLGDGTVVGIHGLVSS